MSSPRRRSIPGPALLLIAAGFASLANFAFHAAGSRALGPAGYSSLAALMALLVIVAVPVGAVQTAVTQASAGAPSASAAATIERATHLGLLLLAAGAVAAIPLNSVLRLHDGWGVALTAAWAAVACIGAVAKGALLGRLRYAPVAAALFAAAFVRVALGFVLVPWLRVEGAMLATLIGETVSAAIVVVALRRSELLSASAPPFQPRGTDAAIALVAQLGLWVLAGVATVMGRRVLPASEAGNYAAASTITNAATFLPLAVATAFFPKFARDGSRNQLNRALLIAFGLGGAAAGVLIVAPSDAVQFLAGRSFQANGVVVGLLALQSMLVGITGVAVFYLLARRRPAALAVWIGAAGCVVSALAVGDAVQLATAAFATAAISTVVTVRAAMNAANTAAPARERWLGLPQPDRLVSVVVPSYNSGAALRPTVLALCRTLDATNWRYEIIVEIDGSTDGSQYTLGDLPANVIIDASPCNEGKGAALRRGFARARGVYVGFVDGDGDIEVEIVPQLARACQRPGVWAAIASKHATGADVHMSRARAVLSRGYRCLVRVLFGLDITDTQCGAKMFSRRGLEQALPWARERGFALDVELLGLGRRLQLGTVEELPVRLRRATRQSTVSPSNVFRTLDDTLRVWSRVLDTPVALTVPATGVTLGSVDLVEHEDVRAG